MAKVLGIISGKGGVGKTTTAINLGLVLNNLGRRVVVVDGDLLKPNVGAFLGASHKEGTLHDAIRNKKSLDELVYVHNSGLKYIPGDFRKTVMLKLDKALLRDMKSSELIILDTPTGYGPDAQTAVGSCDAVLVVVTPDTVAVQEGLKAIRLAEKQQVQVLGLVVNRYKPGSSLFTPEDVAKISGKPVMAVINEEPGFEHTIGHPLAYSNPESEAVKGFKKLAGLLLGEKYVELMDKRETKLQQILKRLGIKR